ncbi:MAG: sugar phosphate isomerase/epimerase [Clostridia bacterium]|nr:sugar phosphate isomerase/epimerase [Clostridia bacterium]
MKLATTTGDLAGFAKSHTEAMEITSRAGFTHFDYNFGVDSWLGKGVYSRDSQGYYENIREFAEEKGFHLVQAHSPMGRPIAADNEAFLKLTADCVEACGKMGIPQIVVHSGYEMGLTKKECFARNREFFLPLLEVGEKWGVNVLVENFNKMEVPGLYWVDNAPDLLELIETVDHPLFHAVWDTGHANMQEMPQSEAIGILGSHVLGVHVHDNDGTGDTHLTPYLGTLSMDSVMQGLLAVGYKGCFTFEVGGIFAPADKRRRAEKEKLLTPGLEIRLAMEKYLYELGKNVLMQYGCFEE